MKCITMEEAEVLTKEKLVELRKRGLRFAEIGRMFPKADGRPLSRERVRQIADNFGIGSYCTCGRELETAKQSKCDRCLRDKQQERYEREKHKNRKPKDFSNRPVVEEAYQFLEDAGANVEYNVSAGRKEPELIVNGKTIKCSVIIPVSRGHQVRLDPLDVDYFYLSDKTLAYIIPGEKITKHLNYIGQSNPLRQYAEVSWLRRILEVLKNG